MWSVLREPICWLTCVELTAENNPNYYIILTIFLYVESFEIERIFKSFCASVFGRRKKDSHMINSGKYLPSLYCVRETENLCQPVSRKGFVYWDGSCGEVHLNHIGTNVRSRQTDAQYK